MQDDRNTFEMTNDGFKIHGFYIRIFFLLKEEKVSRKIFLHKHDIIRNDTTWKNEG